MNKSFSITIDGLGVEVKPGESVLDAARKLGIDIPTLCYLERCGPLNTCQVCLVKINGRLVPSCGTKAVPGMMVESETEEVHESRRTALELLFSDHVGDCLSPCHRLCPLQLNIPVVLRHIEAGRMQDAALLVRQALPLAGVLGRLCHHPCEQGCRRGNWDSPAAIRELEKYVTDWEFGFGVLPMMRAAPVIPKPPGGKQVVVIGAGPTGLAAAHLLARQGHNVTVVDRRARPGGTLCDVNESDLPQAIRQHELDVLAQSGIEFKSGVTLGVDVSLEGLARSLDAIILAIGEISQSEGEELGLPMSGNLVKADPNTCRLPVPKVFAAGSMVRPHKQLIRAMAEGRAVAECVDRFLKGQNVHRPEKPFSSVMGRMEPGELKQFLRNASAGHRISCDRCSVVTRAAAASESSRCLHCDCHSSGNCVLQHYAQVYRADANRFRTERREFDQQLQPGGIIFEPGKCILCGICVKLTEQAAEPLGLTFVGRGFEVRVAAPFNESIERGLKKVAAECVEHCPTGALLFDHAIENKATPIEFSKQS